MSCMNTKIVRCKNPVLIANPQGLDLVGPEQFDEPLARWFRLDRSGFGKLDADHVQVISVDPPAQQGGPCGLVRASTPEGEERAVLLSAEELHLPLHDLAERLRAAAAFWPGRTVVLVEESTLGPALVAELVAAGLEVESAPASGSKSARLLRCSAIPFGSIHRVPSSHGWTFLDAVLALPRSEAVRQHSHVLDALSQLLAWVFGLQATEPRRVHTDEFFQVFREDTGSSIGFVWRDGGSRWRYAVGMKRAPRFEPSRDSAIAALEGEARRAGVSP